MNDLDKIMNTDDGEESVRDFFKSCLKVLLLPDPPRIFFRSDLRYELAIELAKSELISGGVKPCCDKDDLCEGENPCFYNYQCDSKEVDEEIKRLIELL